jgi:hypothetical protein
MPLDYTGKVVVRGSQIAEIGLEQLYVDPLQMELCIEYRFKTRSS